MLDGWWDKIMGRFNYSPSLNIQLLGPWNLRISIIFIVLMFSDVPEGIFNAHLKFLCIKVTIFHKLELYLKLQLDILIVVICHYTIREKEYECLCTIWIYNIHNIVSGKHQLRRHEWIGKFKQNPKKDVFRIPKVSSLKVNPTFVFFFLSLQSMKHGCDELKESVIALDYNEEDDWRGLFSFQTSQ